MTRGLARGSWSGRLPAALIPALLAAGGVQPGVAEDAAPAAIPAVVETIQVRGRTDEVETLDPAIFATVIRAEDFAGRVTSLPELLRAVVGVQISSLGGEFATVSIRGSAAEQVMIYLDGVPLNRALGGAVNLADLPLNQVESIAVYRGFTPAGLPAASIGGAILVTTRGGTGAGSAAGDGTHPTAGSGWTAARNLSATYGSFSTAEAVLSAAGGRPGFDYSVGLDAGRSAGDFEYFGDGGTAVDPADDGTTQRRNNDFERLHLTGRAGFRAGGRGRVTLTTDLFGRDRGVPGKGSASFEAARLTERRAIARADLEVPGLWGGRILVRGAADATAAREEFVNPIAGVGEQTHTDNQMNALGAEGSILWTVSAHHAITLFASRRRETADLADLALPSPDLGSARRDTTAIVLEDQIGFHGDRIVLNPSIRRETYDNDFRPGAGTALYPDSLNEGEAFTTGKFGLRVRASETITLRANAGRFVRLPSFTEMFGYSGSIKGNPALRPEEGRNLDVGIVVTWPGAPRSTSGHARTMRPARIEAALFETVAGNLILFWPNSQSVVFARNLGQARIRGVELSLALAPFRRLETALNWTEQRAINEGPGVNEGNLLPGRPGREISATASLAIGGGRLFYGFTYVGRNYVDLQETDSSALPARYVHDLGWRHGFAHGLEATVELKNLTDEQVSDVAGFPLPGRSALGKLSWAF